MDHCRARGKGRRLVAYRLLYRCEKQLFEYQTAYHHVFSSLSPGTIAICAGIDYGFERGFDEFDFLTGRSLISRDGPPTSARLTACWYGIVVGGRGFEPWRISTDRQNGPRSSSVQYRLPDFSFAQ